jgi:SAM-dependent methyltransferase
MSKISANAAPTIVVGADRTREPQYNNCLEIRDALGLAPLGLMTNQVWHDDPRRLAFLLARYKFVSKMLSGKKFVGELGCGDAFGARIVLQEVGHVVAYDFDPVFIDDIRQRQSKKWPIVARLHDIVEAPLPDCHDGVYSLDVIEHIDVRDEDAYLRNLRDSLTDDGVLIIGTPSLESQEYASPPSKAGHVNCKSGVQLKALLGNYFENVFLFSMNDEVVHTGFSPMAHYLFAVCCQKKNGPA